MECIECKSKIELTDTTHSNVNTDRCNVGQHTGDIYYCLKCEIYWLDNLLSGKIEKWEY